MTKCSRDECNRKSTAYNQIGENYFEQLSAYNSMSAHLRRLLLAKSIVEARNKSYECKKGQRPKFRVCMSRIPGQALSSNIIDRLAYDSRHHPTDIIRMNLGATCQRDDPNCCSDCCDNCNAYYSRLKAYAARRSAGNTRKERRSKSTPRTGKCSTQSASVCQSKVRNPSLEINISGKTGKAADVKNSPKTASPLPDQGYEEDTFQCVSSSSGILTPESNRLLGLSSSSENSDERDCPVQAEETPGTATTTTANNQEVYEKDEREKYAEFVYEITQEIMHNGLYTDNELQDVFKRHIDRNKDKLNMGKMLYEVYQLKASLSVSDDSDVDDEFEDFIHNQQLSTGPEIRPPTPPKVLNENKVIEKLMCYRKITEDRRRSSDGGKSVVLVDANPELLVTERDVLLSLMEVNIEPELAQRVCKSLFHKSRSSCATDTVRTETEVLCPSKSPPNHVTILKGSSTTTAENESRCLIKDT